MASLVIIVPLIFFTVVGAVAAGLFGAALPMLASLSPWLSFATAAWFEALLKLAILILGVAMPMASVLTWMERKESAMMQDRLGPNRAAVQLPVLGKLTLAGLMHFVADAMKMMFKEDFVPAKANRALFSLAPVLAIAPVFVVFAIVPWSAGYVPGHLTDVLTDEQFADFLKQGVVERGQVLHLDVGMLFYFAIASIAVYGTTLAGWASYNKWSLLGGMRASSQMMSYEVTMGMAIMGTFLLMGSLEPNAIVEWQRTHYWGLFVQPLGFILFFTAAIAETKRAPFDIPEGESEIVGYFIEYSGLRFGMFYLAEFIEVALVAGLVSTLFLGGYTMPGLHANGIPALADIHPALAWFGHMPHWLVSTLHFTIFGFKLYLLCWLQLAIRWTLPRLRPDQLMDLGWKGLLPLSLVNLLITAGLALALG